MRNQLFSSLALLVSAAVFSPASAVDDLLGGSPLSDVAPNLAFLDHPKPPNPSFWGDVQGPYQTNSWWENLVLDDGDQPVSTLPFLLKTLEDGVHVCMPEKVNKKG